jgi:hypothetical protein
MLLVLAFGAVLAVIKSLTDPVRPGFEGGLLESFTGEQSAYNWCPHVVQSLHSPTGIIPMTDAKVALLCEVMVYFAKPKGTESFFEVVRAAGEGTAGAHGEKAEAVLEFAPSLRIFRVGGRYFVSPSLESALHREGLLQERKADRAGTELEVGLGKTSGPRSGQQKN